MIFNKSSSISAFVALSLMLLSPAHSVAAPGCDRACLSGLIDQYIAALLAHDPVRLPQLSHVKFTENTNAMPLGDGLWRTIDSVGTYRLIAADPSSHQAMLFTTAKENGQPVFLSFRLKESGGKLSEVEQFVVRKQLHISGDYDGLHETEPVWSQPLDVQQRVTRAEMIRAVSSYFDGIEKGHGAVVPFDPECTRILNGGAPDTGLESEMNTGVFNYIQKVTQRRFLVVDEDSGVVAGTFMFQHPGNIKIPASATYLGKPLDEASPDPNAIMLGSFPNTTEIIEAFKIRNGKLYRIFGYISLLPYHQSPGW